VGAARMGGPVSTTGYVECETGTEADLLEVEIGQEYAASIGKPWPMPPDIVGPGPYPCGLATPTPYASLAPARQTKVFHQTHYVRAQRYKDGTEGGVLVVDETIDGLSDMAFTKVDLAGLSLKARALVEVAVDVDVDLGDLGVG
jgi:hypothetical protein